MIEQLKYIKKNSLCESLLAKVDEEKKKKNRVNYQLNARKIGTLSKKTKGGTNLSGKLK